MIQNIEDYKKRHITFWDFAEVNRPLVGFTIGMGLDSWSYWQYNRAAQALFNRDQILAEDIHPEEFVEDQLKYLKLCEQIDDDIFSTAMPLASIPWMEAILGCPITSTEAGFKSTEFLENAASLQPLPFNSNNPWIKKYLQFIEVYSQAFGTRYPVAQSVLRGPSDLASALLGAENAILALMAEPQEMRRLLEYVTDQLAAFLQLQLNHLPKFYNGYVIGQYDIWSPEPGIRIQEDFTVLYSPKLYSEFIQPLDKKLSLISAYTLIHLHASSLFLIDRFLEVSPIRAYQITKDPGSARLLDMLPGLHKIQQAGKPLIVKGQFDQADLNLLKENLSLPGLCIQPVVKDISEAQKLLPFLRNWR